jgi:hypothetical protein
VRGRDDAAIVLTSLISVPPSPNLLISCLRLPRCLTTHRSHRYIWLPGRLTKQAGGLEVRCR